MSLELVPRTARALSAQLNAYFRVLKGVDPDSVALRLPSGGSFEVRHSVTAAPMLRVTDTGATVSGTLGLPAQSVTSAMIVDGTITGADIAPGTITSDKLVTGAPITPDSITEVEIAPSTITGSSGTSSIGANVIHANRLMDNSVDASQVNRLFGTEAIDASTKVADGSVTTVKITPGAVSQGGIAMGSSSSPSTSAGSPTPLADMSVALTCTGRPVEIDFSGVFFTAPGAGDVTVSLWADGVALGVSRTGSTFNSSSYVTVALRHRYTPSAGAHTFAAYYHVNTGSVTASSTSRALIVTEMKR